ncbi:MAG: TrkA C-terminal domain-containing protein [Actinomycetota bacterium]
MEFVETPMPGVGVRYTTTTAGGRDVGVVVFQSGRRDLVVYDEDDPDSAGESIRLTEEEGRALGEVLGGSRIVEHVGELAHRIEGLVIAWVEISDRSEVAGLTLDRADLRARTGASVVALVDDDDVVPAPGGTDALVAGATAVVVGTEAGVASMRELLRGVAADGSG